MEESRRLLTSLFFTDLQLSVLSKMQHSNAKYTTITYTRDNGKSNKSPAKNRMVEQGKSRASKSRENVVFSRVTVFYPKASTNKIPAKFCRKRRPAVVMPFEWLWNIVSPLDFIALL
jgi:hypothetical protein